MQLSSGVASAVAAGAATSHSESVNVASYALVHDGICVRVCVYRIASCAAPSCRVASFRRVQARAESGGCLSAVPQTVSTDCPSAAVLGSWLVLVARGRSPRRETGDGRDGNADGGASSDSGLPGTPTETVR